MTQNDAGLMRKQVRAGRPRSTRSRLMATSPSPWLARASS
jgi:hypothetical protein